MDAKTDAAKKSPSELPDPGCELLYGVRAIARWMGLTRGQARRFIDTGMLPTFRPPGRSVRCAVKSQLNEVFREWSKRR